MDVWMFQFLNTVIWLEFFKQINKPNLPLASGEFSMSKGVLIVVACGILVMLLLKLVRSFDKSYIHYVKIYVDASFVLSLQSFAIEWKSRSPPVLFALCISFLLGSVYSIDVRFFRYCWVMISFLIKWAFFIYFELICFPFVLFFSFHFFDGKDMHSLLHHASYVLELS